jgi:hypothetical protein
MAALNVNVSGNFAPYFTALLKQWPNLKIGLLHFVGYEGRRELYESYLRGQVIDLRVYPKDSGGKRTVSYSIQKNKKSVKIASYPLNLYNPQSVYAQASTTIEGRIKSALKNYDEKILLDRINKIEAETAIKK